MTPWRGRGKLGNPSHSLNSVMWSWGPDTGAGGVGVDDKEVGVGAVHGKTPAVVGKDVLAPSGSVSAVLTRESGRHGSEEAGQVTEREVGREGGRRDEEQGQ